MPARKRFSKDLFEKYDAMAKAAGIEHLKGQKYVIEICPNPARYGADLLYVTRKTKTAEPEEKSLECEVKAVWKGGKFPYADVQVPGRKAKYFTAGTDYLLLAENAQDYCLITHNIILESALQEVPNKYVWSGEEFYKVPVENCVFKRFDFPMLGGMSFCCAETKLKREGSNGVWVCESCGNTEAG